MGHKNPIKAHEVVRDKVEAALDGASKEIAEMFIGPDGPGLELATVAVRQIIYAHAYYGDVRSGIFTPEQERELAALHEANAEIKEQLNS